MIVKSILDTDLYKFTTSYAYMKLFPHAIGTFEFFDRDNTEYTEEFVQQLRMEIVYFCSLHLTQEEQDYMTTHCRFIPPMYWEWLSGIKLSSGKVSIWLDEDKHLHITAKDYLYRVTLYEVPILAIVSELVNKFLLTLNVLIVWMLTAHGLCLKTGIIKNVIAIKQVENQMVELLCLILYFNKTTSNNCQIC